MPIVWLERNWPKMRGGPVKFESDCETSVTRALHRNHGCAFWRGSGRIGNPKLLSSPGFQVHFQESAMRVYHQGERVETHRLCRLHLGSHHDSQLQQHALASPPLHSCELRAAPALFELRAMLSALSERLPYDLFIRKPQEHLSRPSISSSFPRSITITSSRHSGFGHRNWSPFLNRMSAECSNL